MSELDDPIRQFSVKYEHTKQIAQRLVDEYLETGDFDRFLASSREAALSVAEPTFAVDHLCIILSDRLAASAQGASKRLIADAGANGITPWENFHGERLQAMSCLFQLLLTSSEETIE